MARSIKANAVKPKAKAKSSKVDSKLAVADKRAQMTLVSGMKSSSAKKTAAKAEPVVEVSSTTGDKKVSQRLIETIQKRKQQAKGATPGRIPGRRGRRPKALAEYVPTNNEEDNFNAESDFEGLEYDTGIRVKNGKDDSAFSMDRFEEFDEELNFDW